METGVTSPRTGSTQLKVNVIDVNINTPFFPAYSPLSIKEGGYLFVFSVYLASKIIIIVMFEIFSKNLNTIKDITTKCE